jgi:hypothetical protein
MDFIAFFAKSLSSSACRHRSIQQLCNTQAVVVSVVVYKRPGHVHDVHFLDRLDLRYMIPRMQSLVKCLDHRDMSCICQREWLHQQQTRMCTSHAACKDVCRMPCCRLPETVAWVQRLATQASTAKPCKCMHRKLGGYAGTPTSCFVFALL